MTLDYDVATKILGWTPNYSSDNMLVGWTKLSSQLNDDGSPKYDSVADKNFSPSVHLKDAWVVLSVLKIKTGRRIQIELLPSPETTVLVRVGHSIDGLQTNYSCEGETFPLALCHTALSMSEVL